MELFREDGCLSDEGLHALTAGQLDELGRLEAAEHLAYCDKCTDRYTALLTADALADLVYVIYGMAIESGMDLESVLAEVQASNLSKLMPDGSVKLREDGKVLKGPNFFQPNIARGLGLDTGTTAADAD